MAVVLASALPPAGWGATQVGDLFPSMAAAGLSGPPLPAMPGQVVLVDLWASWCAPCRQSFPAYARLFNIEAARGLRIIAVSVDEDPVACEEFLRRFKPPFEIARDTSHSLVRQLEVPTMPTLYVVDRAGRVRYIHLGYHGTQTDAKLRAEVEALLAEKSP